MTRTCSQCSANDHGTCRFHSCDMFAVKCSEVKLCGPLRSGETRNGWDIEWKASTLTWLMDSDGDWELYTEGYRYLGLVVANSTRTQWMAFFDLHEIGPFDDIKDAARSLVARVKGDTDG